MVALPVLQILREQFKEYQVNYLLGVAAGKLTRSNHIGALGALDIPFLHRYTDAFVEGRSVLVEPREARRRVGFMADTFVIKTS